MGHRQHREYPQGLGQMHILANNTAGRASHWSSPMVSALATASRADGTDQHGPQPSFAPGASLASHDAIDLRDTPLWGKTTDWRAVCGKTARTVRREGRVRTLPYPYRAPQTFAPVTSRKNSRPRNRPRNASSEAAAISAEHSEHRHSKAKVTSSNHVGRNVPPRLG
jgi:hypothetical protein